MQRKEDSFTAESEVGKRVKIVLFLLTLFGIGVVVIWVFNVTIHGENLLEYSYYFLLYGLFGTCGFLSIPARKKDVGKATPWYDLLAAALIFGLSFYFFLSAWQIHNVGWSPPPSTLIFILGLIYILLILEGARRTGGTAYLIVVLVLFVYPLVAGHMPSVFYGRSYTFTEAIATYMFGGEGVLGIIAKSLWGILVTFLIFAGFLVASGAGKFFLNLAFALAGKYRGGPAKVSVLGSAFFGSLSGSASANIAAVGSVTIPTMKRIGYPAVYAAAIEACASTGGILMPPVMGAVAFVMCMLVGVPYSTVIIAAAIPSILYYFGLLIQVDAYAAKTGIKGLPPEQIPSFLATLKKGWPFLAVIVFLVWGLIYMKWEVETPLYASVLLIILSFANRENWMTPRRIAGGIVEVGKLLGQMTLLMLPAAIIIASLVKTGVSGSITSSMVALGGGNIYLVLLLGVVICYILGMVGMMTPAYIFLAINLAPVLVKSGMDVIAVHLFILYWAMLSVITPPVAIAAFVASSIAGSNPIKTSWLAARLGIVLYFLPFFFVFNPALIFRGPLVETLYLFILCAIGIACIAWSLEGYLPKLGKIPVWTRVLICAGGFLIGFPELNSSIVGAILVIAAIGTLALRRYWKLKKGLRPETL